MITEIKNDKLYQIYLPNVNVTHIIKDVHINGDFVIATAYPNGTEHSYSKEYFFANAEEYASYLPFDVMEEFSTGTDILSICNTKYFDKSKDDCTYPSEVINDFLSTAQIVLNFLMMGNQENIKKAESEINDFISYEMELIGIQRGEKIT